MILIKYFLLLKMKSFTINFILIFLLISMSKSMVEFQDEPEPAQEFRAVWSSAWGEDSDLVTFKSIEQFKQNMTYILDTLKMYNMNVLIYHVRTHNDAFYQSELNPISPYFEKVDYNKFDPLKWMIDETHRRGIEFHAWMNPYRIKSDNKTKIEDILKKYENYPKNPASKKENILYGSNTIVMDPGLENVRDFIADTIIEFLDKYDVEAIHFDDYFYCDMGAYGAISGNITILDEPDQKTYNDYINSHPGCQYNNNSATDKADWRRYQVDLLIKLLRDKIIAYNQQKNKHIQFGISPTGVYKNGDGKVTYDENKNAITNGSDTLAQEHYASYLFCDTVKWCNEGWIDYLLPQSYWARTNPYGPFEKIIDWWDKVLKYKSVNLYSGIGLYMANLNGNTYSWKTDYEELYKDLKDIANSEIIDGASIYNFHALRTLRDGEDKISSKQVQNGMKAWTKRVPPSEIKSFDKIVLDAPQNIMYSRNVISFDKVENAKFYIIYGNKEPLQFKEDEIKDIIGNPDNNERVEWKEINETDDKYYYGIKAISYSNTLGNGSYILKVEEPPQEFRAVWSSPWGDDADLVTFISKEQFIQNMTYILDTLKECNINVLIYHVRTHNDALYKSALNPPSRYFENVSFDEFDPLGWMINETHRRGIEFHAWMNPYRIRSDNKTSVDKIAEQYKNYPKNPASNASNILLGNDYTLMNPGLEEIREFIVETVIEFLDKYDVEAIHFDDYFYCDMGANGKISGDKTILDEPDQKTYTDYIDSHPGCQYNNNSASDKANWRRYQVDLLIKLLRDNITAYNEKHHKYIQFGISPTGVYKNGDGKVIYDENGTAITNGSDTHSQQHYASYLFCDTLKWCNLGWIDYILPQNYWSRNHPNAPFLKILDWWDKVLLYKDKINLYQGIGLYQANRNYNGSWNTDLFELYKDLKDVQNSNRSEGSSIYNFHALRTYRDGEEDKISTNQTKNGMKAWTKRVPPVEINSFNKIYLGAPKNGRFYDNILSFDKVEDAKFYIIYQNKGEIQFTADEIIDIVGNPEKKSRIEWKAGNNNDYKYGIRAISYSNTLGEKTTDIHYGPPDTDSNSSNINILSLLALGCLLILLY